MKYCYGVPEKKKMPLMFELSQNSQHEQVGFGQAHQPVISC